GSKGFGSIAADCSGVVWPPQPATPFEGPFDMILGKEWRRRPTWAGDRQAARADGSESISWRCFGFLNLLAAFVNGQLFVQSGDHLANASPGQALLRDGMILLQPLEPTFQIA